MRQRRPSGAAEPSAAPFSSPAESGGASAPALSPCVGVCRIDPETLLCEGCRRTLAEIAGWPGYDEELRREILAALPARAPVAGGGAG